LAVALEAAVIGAACGHAAVVASRRGMRKGRNRMGDVVQFPAKASNDGARQAQNKAAHTEHAKTIREAVERSRRMGDTDRRRVAENLWRILAEAEQKGRRKAEILHAGGQGGEGDSTKRMPYYALDPSLSQEDKNRRADKLTQDPRKYLKIGDAAGNLLHGNADYFLGELFGGTSIVVPSSRGIDTDTPDIYTELASLIADTVAAITRKRNLTRVFRHIGEYRLWRRDLFRSYHGGKEGSLCTDDGAEEWASLWQNFADNTRVVGIDDLADSWNIPELEYWDKAWILPYPTLRIGWTLPRADYDNYKLLTFDLCQDYNKTPVVDQHGAPISAYGDLVGEVRLGILPIGNAGAPEAVFISRLWTLIWLRDSDIDSIPERDGYKFPEKLAWPFLPSDRVMIRWLEEPCGIKLVLRNNIADVEAPLATLVGQGPPVVMRSVDDSEADGKGGVTIERVSPTSCRTLLGLRYENLSQMSPMSPAQCLLTDTSNIRDDFSDYVCRTSPETIGRIVEKSFFHAQTEYRLDALLDQEVRRLADEVDALVSPYLETSRRIREEILSRLNQDPP
jgi:hypothetical protein